MAPPCIGETDEALGYRTCPHCGQSETLRSLHYENDVYLWMLGCGRGGFLLVSLSCKFALQFDGKRMS